MSYLDDVIKEAKMARDNAYAPYSYFQVGAAVLMESGTIYSGCNIENSSYSLTCCAERVAIFKAISNGDHHFKCLVVIGNTIDPISPCGACRQVMSEFFDEKMPIYLLNKNDELKETTVGELLPYTFRLNE